MSGFGIGSVGLDGRAFLAPMSGVTDVVMRRIARRLGASAVVSEMVACDQFVKQDAETCLRAEGQGVSPHIVQLAGRDPHWMREAALLAEASGAAVVDINMGCPAKRVIGGYAGSALMRDLDLAARLIEAAVKAVSIPVTVKMRLGWDDASINAPELARRAERLGAALITVHARTRNQFYKGTARWREVRPVVEATNLPVVINGDIGSAAQARHAFAESGAAAVMIGRAALGRPWLVGDIARELDGLPPRPISRRQAGEIAVEHYEGLLTHFGLAVGIRHARKHVAAYFAELGETAAQAIAAKAVRSDDPAEVIALLRQAFNETAERLAA